MSARRFLNTAFGVSNGGLAAWGIAGAGAYYFMYLPEKQRADAEVIRAANAGKLMKQKNYVEFVKDHEAKRARVAVKGDGSEDGSAARSSRRRREDRGELDFQPPLVAELGHPWGRAFSPRALPTASTSSQL